MQPDRIYIQFAENGHIRKWQREPFEEGTEYHSSPAREQVTEALAIADRYLDGAKRCAKGEFYRNGVPISLVIQQHQELRDEIAALSPSPTGGEAGAAATAFIDREGNVSVVTGSELPKLLKALPDAPVGKPLLPLYTHPAPKEALLEGWRDMVSAPKDGSAFLAWDGFSVFLCFFNGGLWQDQPTCSPRPHAKVWIPLPAAPALTKLQEGER